MAEYISKDSAISLFNAKAEMAVCTPAQPYFAKAAKMIELLPAADVAPVVHGRWEKWNGDDRHHCTVCECYANAERQLRIYRIRVFRQLLPPLRCDDEFGGKEWQKQK